MNYCWGCALWLTTEGMLEKVLRFGDVSDALQRCRDALDSFPVRRLASFLSGGILFRLLWNQYGVCFRRRSPYHDLGLPVFGHTLAIFQKSLEVWADAFMAGKPPLVLTNFIFGNVVLVKYPLYQEYVQKVELDGGVRPVLPAAISKVIGKNSVLFLPGGQGHKHHKRLRTKLLSSLAPKPSLAVLPEMEAEVRTTLDGLAEATAKDGFTSFDAPAGHMAAKISVLQITAGLHKDLQLRVEHLIDTVIAAIVAAPINLGRFSAFGRAMQARGELRQIIEELVANPVVDKRNILADLAKSSESGEAFSLEETVDTVITLLLAGKLTTADVLPHLFVALSQYPEWAAKVAQEKLEFGSIEEDSASLRVVLECIRRNPPAGAYRRQCSTSIDMGEHGRIPAECPFAVLLGIELREMAADFDPNRWTPEFVRRHGMLAFGGNQPHSCIGKSLALLELQLFARVLCREYEFQALNTELIVKPTNPLNPRFKDGLRVAVTRKA